MLQKIAEICMTKMRDYAAFVKALKEVGKAVESHYDRKVPTPTSAAPLIPPTTPPPLEPMSQTYPPSTPLQETPTIVNRPTSSGPGEC